ncbi:MAG: hypothetical protein C5S47_00590 [Candidatus Methanogasteraceae archaeon]|nr:MAG: hypothetical protein C5S47_00590 [ANME-2 cluster archaeon]
MWQRVFFTITGTGLTGWMMRGSAGSASAGSAGIGCIVGECEEGDLLFVSRVCYQWLEYPEKSELWHNAVSS